MKTLELKITDDGKRTKTVLKTSRLSNAEIIGLLTIVTNTMLKEISDERNEKEREQAPTPGEGETR